VASARASANLESPVTSVEHADLSVRTSLRVGEICRNAFTVWLCSSDSLVFLYLVLRRTRRVERATSKVTSEACLRVLIPCCPP
jgi:hypothetical protein